MTAETRFLYKDLYRKGTILGQSSQDPQHPSLDTQVDTRSMFWRSGAMEKLVDGGLNEWLSSTDLEFWTEYSEGTSTVNRASAEAHKIEGAYSCRLDVDAGNNNANIAQNTILIPNKRYKLIIWYKNSLADKTVGLQFFDLGTNVFLKEDGTWQASDYVISLSNSLVWEKYELEFNAHANYTNYKIAFKRGAAASSSIYFDAVSLKECPSISLDVGEFEAAGIGTMNFDAGRVEPVVGEWLMDSVSGAKGRVVSVTKSTGDWGTEDAAGSIELEKCEGRFHDNSPINGERGGEAMLIVNHPKTGAGVDLVRNGEFSELDDPPSGWSAGNTALLTTEAGGKIGNCIAVTENGTINPCAYQLVSLIAGKTYKFIAHIKAGTEATYRIYLEDTNNYIILVDTKTLNETAGDWSTNFTAVFKVPKGCTTVSVYLYQVCIATARTTTYFDEVSLYQLDEEETEKQADSVAILGHNLSPKAEIKLIGAMDEEFTEALKTIDVPWHKDDIFLFFPYWGDDVLTDGGLNIWTTATNLTHWTENFEGDSTVNRESAQAHKIEGAYSCRLDVDGSGSFVEICDLFSMLPNKKHKIIVWYKNSVADKTGSILLLDSGLNFGLKSDGTWASGAQVITLENSTIWKKFELDFYTHADYSGYRLYLRRAIATSSSIYFDKVSIRPYPPDGRTSYPVLRRYWKPEITDPDNPDGYVQAAVVKIGKYFEPNIDYVRGYAPGREDYSEVELTDSLVLHAQEKPILKKWYLPYWGLNDASRNEILALMEECGKHKAFIVVFDKNNQNSDSHLVRLEELSDPVFQFLDKWNWEMAIKEII